MLRSHVANPRPGLEPDDRDRFKKLMQVYSADERLGKAIAVLGMEPDAIRRRFQISFAPGEDDLDTFQYAVVQARNGQQFAFVRRSHAPSPGTEILTVEDSKSVYEDLLIFLDMVGLSRHHLSWVHPKIPPF